MRVSEAGILIKGFEDGTFPKKEWTHHAHFVMALWYCFHLPLPVAIDRIKEGIKKYNLATGGTNTDDSGYHETITIFYIYTINHYILHSSEKDNLEKLLNALSHQPFIEKDFTMRYYTKEILMSRQARKEWTVPDKRLFCFAW